jgi:competence protein ComEC
VAISTAYAMLAGWGVPAQRTVWMMLIMALLRSGGRRWPWPLVWLASAVGVTILDPWALRQVGFWLSYVAVAVLMASGTPTPESLAAGGAEANGDPEAPAPSLPARLWLSLTAASSEMLRTQWLVTMALTPLAIVCFQQVSVIGFVANMAAIPLFTIGITPLALLGALWSPFWDVGAWLTQLTLSMLVDLSAWPWAVAQAPALPWWVAASVVIGGFALALPARWSWRLAALPFFLPLLHLPQSWHLIPAPRPGQFQMLAVDVGQGTAVLVRTAHHSLLFDAGPRIGEQSDAGDRILLPLLQALGVRELDTLLISHQDTDHVGGAASIVRSLPVAQLISSLDPDHPLRHQPGVSGKALPHEPCVAGQHWAWDGVDFNVLHPSGDPDARAQHKQADKPNAHSCILRVNRGGDHPVSALIAADIEADQEAAILARAESSDAGLASLQSTVLVAPHHGSRTSSTKAFLQAVNPAQLVIQVGRRNRYGHPSPSVLARYEAMGLPWQATPDCGAYLWSSDEPSLAIRADHAAGASASSLAPRIGSCWRHSHHHYWDAPDTRATEATQKGAEEPQPP